MRKSGWIYTIAGLIIMAIGECINYMQMVDEVHATVQETQQEVIATEIHRQLQEYTVVTDN